MTIAIPTPNLTGCSDTEVLRFVILRAGLYKFKCAHLAVIAGKAGMRPDALARFINNGVFSTKAANAIEKAVGRDLIHWEWLVNPMISAQRGDIF